MNTYDKIIAGEYKNNFPYATKMKNPHMYIAYHEEESRCNERFMLDLFEEFDVVNNPKRFKCFQIAWSKGHSAGHPDVYAEFAEIVELIK